jgi:hypothetical protein
MNEKKIAYHAIDYVEKVEQHARSRKDEDKKASLAALTALCECVRKEKNSEG